MASLARPAGKSSPIEERDIRSPFIQNESDKRPIPRELQSLFIRREETNSPSPTPYTDESILFLVPTRVTMRYYARDIIEDTYPCRPVPHYPTFTFPDAWSHERLHGKLEEIGLIHYFGEQIQTDWNARTGQLTLRIMHSRTHEVSQNHLIDAIREELSPLAKENRSLRALRENIPRGGWASIGDTTAHKLPDGQFFFDGHHDVYFVVEVAYSELEHSLLAKIPEYFTDLHSDNSVLTIGIRYAPPEIRNAPSYTHSASFLLRTA
ncbi:hypothetical protein F4859DRAFT_518518 [Xylaria cf. heliscus]|nr:hypothetical protein F4859DRAFT_518518 [Xylaria cf. heliscus]